MDTPWMEVIETMDLLISIKPQFADKILSGHKHFEYRKKIFQKPIDNIYIYSSFPAKKIVGKFKFSGYIEGSPEEIWTKTHEHSGISAKFFFSYYAGKKIAYAIKIVSLIIFEVPVDPYIKNTAFRPPQSFMYVEKGFFG